MAARRIGITPGVGDYVGAVDTELLDASGSEVSAQTTALVSERGEVAGDIYGALEGILRAVNLTNKLLLMQLNRPHKAKG